jgi:hypothetical protein
VTQVELYPAVSDRRVSSWNSVIMAAAESTTTMTEAAMGRAAGGEAGRAQAAARTMPTNRTLVEAMATPPQNPILQHMSY